MIEMRYMKKSVLAVLLLAILIACAPRSELPEPVDFRTGSEGLYMSFVPNLPPPRLFDREPFNAMIQIENRGTHDIGYAGDKIYISGFDNTIITGIRSDGEPIPDIEGRGPFIPQGGIDTVNFRGTISSLTGRRIDKYQPTILATACYTYETVASAQVCIDPNPYAPTAIERVCIPSTVGTGSQGAPIAITSVEVVAAPKKTRFTINLQNVGGGDVFRSGTRYLNSCNPYNPGLSFDEIDYVELLDVSVSGIDIRNDCKPVDNTGHIRLTNGQARLFCELSLPREQSPYLTPLNIILKYGYRQSIAIPIEIRPTA